MEAIDRTKLKELLIEDGYIEANGLEFTIDNLLNLTGPAAEMLRKWMATGEVDKFEPIEGIDKRFLRDKLKMHKPAIILAYGMLLKDPKRNAMLLKREADRRNIYHHNPAKQS